MARWLVPSYWLDPEAKTDTEREEYRELLSEMEQECPDDFWKIVMSKILIDHPEFTDQLYSAAQAEEASGKEVHPQLGIADGELMAGYTIPGTMFSTVTVNRTALFRSHEDSSNLPGGLACLTAFGDFPEGMHVLVNDPRRGTSQRGFLRVNWRPSFINHLHGILGPAHRVGNSADGCRDSLAAVKLRELAGSKNARRYQQHALAALVHRGGLSYSRFVRLRRPQR